jgi:hypothetical protein
MSLINHVLTNQNSCFDGLPEPDLIGEEVPLNWIGENSTDNCDLVFKQLNRRRRETGQSSIGGSLRADVTHNPGAPVEEKWSISYPGC